MPAARSRASDDVWQDLETLASTPLPPPRLRRRAARLIRLAVVVALPVVFSGVEHADLRAAGALSLLPFAVYVIVLYKDYGDRLGLSHTALTVGAIVVALAVPRIVDGDPYLTAAATAPLLIGAVVMGERARRSWDRTGAQTQADMRALLRRRREARRAVTPR